MRRISLLACSITVGLVMCACMRVRPAAAQSVAPQRLHDIPAPASVIGHEVGADYKLARWETIVEYFDTLGAASPRINVRRLDASTEGQPYILAEISSADTIEQLDRYRARQAELADPRRLAGETERRRVLVEAKTTILVSCGLHSNEVAASQMAMELAHDLASGNDPRTREILDNCIILLVPSANPDGHNKIIDWYEKYLGTEYEGGPMPWLYQKYAGHDNNRDWFMLNLKETRILTKLLYEEWHPTILYDIHQMGNRGARFFVPPFFDPVNPNVDPLIHQSLLIIGGHMATELQERNKTGVVFKAIFDNWWQGGNRTTPYRHNIVGILTEAASAKVASPIFQEHGDLKGGGRGFPDYAPTVSFPEPWPGGWWRLRDIVDYEKIACNALFTLAARYRDRFVQNHLTLSEKALTKGEGDPPHAWVIPPEQRDPGATAHMLEVLRLTGIEVHVATQRFTADGRTYPAGTHVLLAAQPYRPHLMDMMERQEYPNRHVFPGGPAESPYDAAGWTLPLQMGVRAVEVVSPLTASLRRVEKVVAPRAVPPSEPIPAAYVTRRRGNSDYAAINALMREGFGLRILSAEHEGYPIGSLIVTGGDRAAELTGRVRTLAAELPARFEPLVSLPAASLLQGMTPPRTALYQPFTASMDEGWTRFVLERFGFPYTTIRNADIRADDLRSRFDCIIMPDQQLDRMLKGVPIERMPPPYAGGIGDDGAMALERFALAGGTLVLMDSATRLATEVFKLPVRDVLKDLPKDKFFCPGSILRVRVDNTHPLGYGFADEAAAYFARSHAFSIGKEALKGVATPKKKTADASAPVMSEARMNAKLKGQPVVSVADYSENIILLSGWILGKDYVRGRSAVCEVVCGEGRVVLLGFRVQHRGQSHGTFKFLFNSIYRSTLSE